MVVLPINPMFESVDLASRPNWKLRITCATIVLALVAVLAWLLRMTQMPLRSYIGPLSPLTAEQSEIRDRLSSDVNYLSVTVGDRSMEQEGHCKRRWPIFEKASN